MNPLLALGLFLFGAGIGALLSAIFYSAKIHQLRSEIESSVELQATKVSRKDNADRGAA